jgi:hypothetical protein
VLRTLGQHCSGTGRNLAFLEQARAAPDQVLVRPLLAAVPGDGAGGTAPVRAPGRRERRGGGGGRRGREEEAVRRTCEGEHYLFRSLSSMSSRVAGQGAAIAPTNWSGPPRTGPVHSPRAARGRCRASKQTVGGISLVLMGDQCSKSTCFCLWALCVSGCV